MKWLTMLLIVGMQRLNALMDGLSVLELLIGLPMTCVLTRYVSESSPNACTIGNDYLLCTGTFLLDLYNYKKALLSSS